jgi:hypothetical protein
VFVSNAVEQSRPNRLRIKIAKAAKAECRPISNVVTVVAGQDDESRDCLRIATFAESEGHTISNVAVGVSNELHKDACSAPLFGKMS